ncbi:MAG: hypothetical protein M3464_12100, partial [Chloroflexota bacterium]|nr:hypothetical protein [Chloroflexota bacterium]
MPLPTAQLDSTPDETYRALRDRYATERDGLTERWNGVANQRLLAFAAGAGVIGWGLWQAAPVAIALGVPLLALFVALALYHHRLGKRRRRAAAMYAINDEAVARIGRDWTALPEPPPVALPPDHPFAADLDLVGRASVLQLIDTTSTPFGFRALTAWLLTPAAPAAVRDRQAAVAALAPGLAFRQALTAEGRLAAEDRRDPEPLLAWAEGPRWLADRTWLRVVAWVGPILLVTLAAAQIAGVVNAPYWVLVLFANLLISQLAGRPANTIGLAVNAHHWALLGYAKQIALVTETPLPAPPLARLQA